MIILCRLWNRLRVLFGFKRKLCGTWTFEKSDELEVMYGIDAAEELAKILAEEINSEIEENGSCTWKEHCEK